MCIDRYMPLQETPGWLPYGWVPVRLFWALIRPFFLFLLVLSADGPPRVEPVPDARPLDPPAGLPAHPASRPAIQRCTGGLAPRLAGATGGRLPGQVRNCTRCLYVCICITYLRICYSSLSFGCHTSEHDGAGDEIDIDICIYNPQLYI